ncbi:MAG: YqzL family protein [Peptococcaceae bacterium]|nr:YqzL family protein [Peptococcaceae bacterium]
MFLTADFFWGLFIATGSVNAYMLYKKMALH